MGKGRRTFVSSLVDRVARRAGAHTRARGSGPKRRGLHVRCQSALAASRRLPPVGRSARRWRARALVRTRRRPRTRAAPLNPHASGAPASSARGGRAAGVGAAPAVITRMRSLSAARAWPRDAAGRHVRPRCRRAASGASPARGRRPRAWRRRRAAAPLPPAAGRPPRRRPLRTRRERVDRRRGTGAAASATRARRPRGTARRRRRARVRARRRARRDGRRPAAGARPLRRAPSRRLRGSRRASPPSAARAWAPRGRRLVRRGVAVVVVVVV